MFKGNAGNMGNMQGMMKKVQKMQADMAKMQEELKTRTIETTAGGGVLTVVVNGQKEIESIVIKPEVLTPEDAELVQDLIVSGINDALRQVDEMTEREMAKITGGMKLPGM